MSQADQYNIFNTLLDGVLIIDKDYTIVFANQQLLHLYGIEEEAIIGGKCFAVLHHCRVPCTEECVALAQCGHKQVFATGRPTTVKHPHLMPDGSEKIFQISISPLFDKKGEVNRVIHVTKDITEQEQLRQKLNIALIEQETIFNNSPYAVSYLDPDQRVIKINSRMEALIGKKSTEVQGKYCYEVWGQHAGDSSKKGREKMCDACRVKDAMADGQSYSYERKVGESTIEVTASPVRDEKGIVIGALETGKDITERKQAEEKLYAYERILSATQDMMSFVNKQYTYQAVNDAYCKVHNKKREEIVGKSVVELLGQEVFDSTIKEQLDRSFGGERICYEKWFDYPGTGRRYMEVTYYPFIDENQIITGTVVTCRDITDRKKNEDALRKSEARYSYLYNNLNDAAFIIGPDGTFLDSNEVAQKRLGYSREEFLHMSPEQINDPAFVSGYKKRLAIVRDIGSAFYETVHIAKDGRTIPTEISSRSIDLDGESCMLALARDISERKDAEVAFKESEYRFREIFNNISNGIAIYEAVEDGSDFIIKDLNPAGLKSSQARKSEILNKSVLEVFPGIVEMGLFEVFQEVYRTGESINQPATLYKDDRISLWVENFVCKLPSREIVAVYDDITERKRAEQELAKSKEEWERTFNSFTDIVTLQDPSMRIIKVNRAGCQTLGLDREDVIAHHCYELFHGSVEPCVACPLLETQKDFQSYTREMYHKKLGKTFLVSAAPVLDAKGELEYIAHVAKDISDLKQLEQELFQAQKMEAIGTLAGGIAHDFNNILSGIIGYSELIKSEVSPDSIAGRDIVEVIDAGKRAATLVKQILTFSRKTESSKTPLHPHLIVKEALKLLRATLPTTIRIEEDIDSNSGTVLADPTNIHQMVVNLCTNALHAMAEEKGTLSVSLRRQELSAEELTGETEASPGPFVVLSVSDTGCGMDRETLDRIFEPYFTTKEVGTGTGLGLAVVHGIAQSVQGFVRVKSTPGEGSTFAVYIPALQEKDGAGYEPVPIAPRQRGHEHILIVDDEAFLVKVTQRQLENLGYRVTGTTDSKDALKKIRTDPDGFDLLITDQTMPGLTGADLARAVKELKPTMPIILCTGHSSVLTKEKSQAMGIDRYIGKPVMGNELSDTVRSLLDEK